MNGMLMGYTISSQTWQLEIPQSGCFFWLENHLLQHQKCDVLCCLDPLFLPIKIPMVQKNTECCLYLLVSWMAITFFGVFKVCFFCEFKPVSA
jgi:hypothetical protein